MSALALARRLAFGLVLCLPLAAGVAGRAGAATGSGPDCAARAAASAANAPSAQAAAPEPASGRTPRLLIRSPRDMVAAAHPLAVDAAVAVLDRGGSAMDAAIAAQFVLNVVEPQSSGIGGGGFLLHHEAASGRLRSYDGRETAPAAADPRQFLDVAGRPLAWHDAIDGGLSVGVPGLARMLELAHRQHGRLPWASLIEPAIAIAEQGFPMSRRTHEQARAAAARLRAQGDPVAAWLLDAHGQARPAGSTLRNPALAASLRRLATGGADVLHEGELAQQIVATVAGHPCRPGRLSLEDLAAYRPREREPVCGRYRGHRICGMGPPSSGGIAVLQTLGMLEHHALRTQAPGSVEAVHLISEALRLAYADRGAYLADPDVVAVPVAGLLDPAYLRARAALIAPGRALGEPAPGRPPGAAAAVMVDSPETPPATTHLSVVDADGNAVALTSSIENGLGSLQMVGGFLLNNQLTDFAWQPVSPGGSAVANALAPGKRPRSTMAPTMVYSPDGALRAVLGSPGGGAIAMYLVKTLVAMIDWELDIQTAIALPNIGALASATTLLERDTPAAALAPALRALGHRVAIVDLNSGLHGIERERDAGGPDGWRGGADPRRDGVARGSR
jgi:gamma-glutamyltranspeptidase/glutathione hydrolase